MSSLCGKIFIWLLTLKAAGRSEHFFNPTPSAQHTNYYNYVSIPEPVHLSALPSYYVQFLFFYWILLGHWFSSMLIWFHTAEWKALTASKGFWILPGCSLFLAVYIICAVWNSTRSNNFNAQELSLKRLLSSHSADCSSSFVSVHMFPPEAMMASSINARNVTLEWKWTVQHYSNLNIRCQVKISDGETHIIVSRPKDGGKVTLYHQQSLVTYTNISLVHVLFPERIRWSWP